jgi:hypothetical protein
MNLEQILAAVAALSDADKQALMAQLMPKTEATPPDGADTPAAKAFKARLDALEIEAKKAREEAAELKEREAVREAVDEAKSLGLEHLPGATMVQHAKALRAIKAHLPKADADALIDSLKSAATAIKTGALLARHGASTREQAGDPIEAKALELQKADPKLTPEQAWVKAAQAEKANYKTTRA